MSTRCVCSWVNQARALGFKNQRVYQSLKVIGLGGIDPVFLEFLCRQFRKSRIWLSENILYDNSTPESPERSKMTHFLATFYFGHFFVTVILEWRVVTNFGKLYIRFTSSMSALKITSGQENSLECGHERAIRKHHHFLQGKI